jgi:ion channel-forming bestrophin family protein
MYTKRNYGFWMTFHWSKKPFIYGFVYAAIVSVIYFLLKEFHGIDISLPWQPISVLGIAVAFYLGFKNNSSYDRTWEARKIWGAIVNNSRSFGAGVCAFVQGENSDGVKKQLIYRHIAWLTALRYQLRLTREWEHTENRVKGLYSPVVSEEYFDKMDGEMTGLIPESEFLQYKSKANMATQIMHKQSTELQRLRDEGYFEDFRHMELYQFIKAFYDEQGKSERIKNFPFPRQYASAALWQTLIFSILMPFGMLSIFGETHSFGLWLNIPFSALVIWVFFLMEKIGDYSENPFEGTYNDVPITSIARGIEIDLREMINDPAIPKPIANENGFLM